MLFQKLYIHKRTGLFFQGGGGAVNQCKTLELSAKIAMI